MYYNEHKLKTKNGGGLGRRLLTIHQIAKVLQQASQAVENHNWFTVKEEGHAEAGKIIRFIKIEYYSVEYF